MSEHQTILERARELELEAPPRWRYGSAREHDAHVRKTSFIQACEEHIEREAYFRVAKVLMGL